MKKKLRTIDIIKAQMLAEQEAQRTGRKITPKPFLTAKNVTKIEGRSPRIFGASSLLNQSKQKVKSRKQSNSPEEQCSSPSTHKHPDPRGSPKPYTPSLHQMLKDLQSPGRLFTGEISFAKIRGRTAVSKRRDTVHELVSFRRPKWQNQFQKVSLSQSPEAKVLGTKPVRYYPYKELSRRRQELLSQCEENLKSTKSKGTKSKSKSIGWQSLSSVASKEQLKDLIKALSNQKETNKETNDDFKFDHEQVVSLLKSKLEQYKSDLGDFLQKSQENDDELVQKLNMFESLSQNTDFKLVLDSQYAKKVATTNQQQQDLRLVRQDVELLKSKLENLTQKAKIQSRQTHDLATEFKLRKQINQVSSTDDSSNLRHQLSQTQNQVSTTDGDLKQNRIILLNKSESSEQQISQLQILIFDVLKQKNNLQTEISNEKLRISLKRQIPEYGAESLQINACEQIQIQKQATEYRDDLTKQQHVCQDQLTRINFKIEETKSENNQLATVQSFQQSVIEKRNIGLKYAEQTQDDLLQFGQFETQKYAKKQSGRYLNQQFKNRIAQISTGEEETLNPDAYQSSLLQKLEQQLISLDTTLLQHQKELTALEQEQEGARIKLFDDNARLTRYYEYQLTHSLQFTTVTDESLKNIVQNLKDKSKELSVLAVEQLKSYELIREDLYTYDKQNQELLELQMILEQEKVQQMNIWKKKLQEKAKAQQDYQRILNEFAPKEEQLKELAYVVNIQQKLENKIAKALHEKIKKIRTGVNKDYLPIPGDYIDELLWQYIKKTGMLIPVKRLGSGKYNFGPQKVELVSIRDELYVKTGGGFQSIYDFTKVCEVELSKAQSEVTTSVRVSDNVSINSSKLEFFELKTEKDFQEQACKSEHIRGLLQKVIIEEMFPHKQVNLSRAKTLTPGLY